VRTPNVTYYAVLMSFSFVLDTMQAQCKEVPWSAVHSKQFDIPGKCRLTHAAELFRTACV